MVPSSVRWALVLPPALPLGVFLFGIGADQVGHRWNVHGDMIGLVAIFLVAFLVGLAIVAHALYRVIPMLIQNPEQRTALNIVCAGIGVTYVLFGVGVAALLLL